MHAFEITADDIANVLRMNAVRVTNTAGHPFDLMAEELFDELEDELYAIERAALDGGLEIEDQTDAAYAQIESILERNGVLKVKASPVFRPA